MKLHRSKFVLTSLMMISLVLNCPASANACWLTDWWFGRNQTPAVAPPVVSAAPFAAPQVTTNYAPYGTQTVAYQVPVVNYVPRTTYRTVYRQIPVTVYRPNVTVMSPSGLPVTNYQGCTTSAQRVQRLPYTSRQPVYSCPPNPCAQPSVIGSAGSVPGYSTPYYTTPATTSPRAAQPGTWVPSGTTPSMPAPSLNSTPRTVPLSPTPATLTPSAATTTPGVSSGSRFSAPAITPSQPGSSIYNNNSPANNPPTLNPRPSSTTPMKPVIPTSPSSTRVQLNREQNTTVAPDSKSLKIESPAFPSGITPIPDPEYYPNLEPAGQAPPLLNPNDKTALLIENKFELAAKPQLIAPASYKTEKFKPRFDNSGWVSTGK